MMFLIERNTTISIANNSSKLILSTNTMINIPALISSRTIINKKMETIISRIILINLNSTMIITTTMGYLRIMISVEIKEIYTIKIMIIFLEEIIRFSMIIQ